MLSSVPITFLAQTNYRGVGQAFGIKRDDRRRHMYVIGKTGMGKSTLLEHMIAQDIRCADGLALSTRMAISWSERSDSCRAGG